MPSLNRMPRREMRIALHFLPAGAKCWPRSPRFTRPPVRYAPEADGTRLLAKIPRAAGKQTDACAVSLDPH